MADSWRVGLQKLITVLDMRDGHKGEVQGCLIYDLRNGHKWGVKGPLLFKQKKQGEICFIIYIAGERK